MGAITGIVWDENQVGLAEQDVVVYEVSRPLRLVMRVTTDDRGSYRVGELPRGRYYVRARGEEYWSKAPARSRHSSKIPPPLRMPCQSMSNWMSRPRMSIFSRAWASYTESQARH